MLRIGVLECDHVDACYRGIAGDYFDMFSALFNRHGVELVRYDACDGSLPATPDECDGWIATGSRRSAYDDLDWIRALAAFLRDVRCAAAPYVGVCFGHQLLAQALGGDVKRAPAGWGVGVHRMEPVEVASDMPDPSCSLLYMHQDQVRSLPEGAVVLGRTDHCPIAMYQVGDTMLGIQAHPELAPPYVEALLNDWGERIGAAKTAAALRTLAEPTDAASVAGWLVRFLACAGRTST